MHAISSYRGNRPTHTQTPTHRQDQLQYTAPQLARSVTRSATYITSCKRAAAMICPRPFPPSVGAGAPSAAVHTVEGQSTSHVTRTPLSRSKGQKSRSQGRFTHRGLNASRSCSGERGNVLGVENHCYAAVCSAALGASAPTEGGEGRGISWRLPAYSLFQS